MRMRIIYTIYSYYKMIMIMIIKTRMRIIIIFTMILD